MANENANRDQNFVTVLTAITDDSSQEIRMVRVDPSTNRILVSATGISSGTVTSVSVVTANGISGSVATATTTPAITLSLGAITPITVNGITFSGSGSIANSGSTSLTSFTGSGISSGINTGNQTITLSGDISGAGTGAITTTIGAGKVTETMQVLADNTTQNVSITKHGYAPKAPNDATKYLDGTGAYSVPAGSGGSGSWTLLKAGNGTDTNTSTTVLDSIALSGLTALDTIVVFFNAKVITQGCSGPFNVKNTTDNKTIGRFTGNNLLTNGAVSGQSNVRQSQSSSTLVQGFTSGIDDSTNTVYGFCANIGVTTAWTGSWTLGIDYGGVTAGGTLQWSWAAYKVAGQ